MTAQSPVLGPDAVVEGLGAFDELEYLGSGTFGETYRAVRGDDEYAIKVIHFEDMPEYLWEREVATLRRVDHPNVVGFRASGRLAAGGRTYPFLECEFIGGGDVQQHLEEDERPGSRAHVRQLLTGLLAGVNEIHDLGILHRDIKPANVALRDGDWGQPVLLDFGLARALDMSSHTDYPARIGTERYMAPEQLRGAPARRRSDLYAVGTVVYEAGTGSHPFASPEVMTAQALHDRVKAGPARDPRELSDHFDEDVARVLVRILSYRAHERLGVDDALRDLENP